MGTSHRYSSATDKPDTADASGSSPITAKLAKNEDHSDELLRAIDHVNQSLKTVLTAIRDIQREIGINNTQDVPLKPDDSWNGTP